jgi:hypothetical protein
LACSDRSRTSAEVRLPSLTDRPVMTTVAVAVELRATNTATTATS